MREPRQAYSELLAIARTGLRPRTALALAMCATLVAACSAVGTRDAGVPGPSWQQRDARHAEETDDPEERLRKAGERAERTGERVEKGMRIWAIVLYVGAGVGLIAALSDEDDELTFEPLREERTAPGRPEFRAVSGVHY